MQVTVKDIHDYWTRYCERHDLDKQLLAEGVRQISLHPEYWADHTMKELQDLVMRKRD